MIVTDFRLDPPEPLDVLCRDCDGLVTDDVLEAWLADGDPLPGPVCHDCQGDDT